MGEKIKEAWTGPGRKDGKITVLKPKDDALHIDINKRGSAEWWYFDARLDNGYTVVAFFRARHERTGKTGVEITVYRPNGEKTLNVYDYARSDFSISPDKADVRIGKNYIKADCSNEKLWKYEIFLDEGEYGMHLKYTGTVHAWMPGSGYTEFENKGHFGWCVALPRADVEGTIKVNNETIPAKGIGYHDHNWLNFNFARYLDFWYWGRIFSENFTMLFVYIKCNKQMDNHEIKVLMLAKGEKVYLSTGECDLIQENFEYNENAGNSYPKSLKFVLPDQQEITLNVQEIIDADSLLDDFNPILRFLAKYLLRLTPGYFRLNSKFNLNLTYEGKKYEEDGTTLHEMVIVK